MYLQPVVGYDALSDSQGKVLWQREKWLTYKQKERPLDGKADHGTQMGSFPVGPEKEAGGPGLWLEELQKQRHWGEDGPLHGRTGSSFEC